MSACTAVLEHDVLYVLWHRDCNIVQQSVIKMMTPQVANYARIADSIVGWGSSLGKWTRVEFKSVIGEDVHVRPEVFLNGSIVLPHKEIKESIMDPGTIIM